MCRAWAESCPQRSMTSMRCTPEGGPHRFGDSADPGGEGGRIEGGHHLVAAKDPKIAPEGRRSLVGALALGHLGKVGSTLNFLAQCRDVLQDGRRVGRGGGFRQGDIDQLGACRNQKVLAIAVVVALNLSRGHLDPVVGDAALGLDQQKADAGALVHVAPCPPELCIGGVDAGCELPHELAARDQVAVVGLELELRQVVGGGDELLVEGNVEVAVGLEGGIGHEVGRRGQKRCAPHLHVGHHDLPPPQLLLNQDTVDDLVPRLVLKLGVLCVGDRLFLKLLLSIVEIAVGGQCTGRS